MGAIASVLQWHCSSCSLINPTERVKCIRCGRKRKFDTNKEYSDTFTGDFGGSANCTVIKRIKSKDNTLLRYLKYDIEKLTIVYKELAFNEKINNYC